MEEHELIHNGLYKLEEKSEKDLNGLHKSNTLLAVKENSQWKFYDIYYGMGSKQNGYSFDEIKGMITFVFDMSKAKDVPERVYDQYQDCHKLYIPENPYKQSRHIIDRTASKSKSMILQLLNDVVERAENQNKLQQAHIDLKKLQIIDIEAGGSIENIEI